MGRQWLWIRTIQWVKVCRTKSVMRVVENTTYMHSQFRQVNPSKKALMNSGNSSSWSYIAFVGWSTGE